ncbi:hypothetical protein HQ487_00760 [Candidatus Uhrbacteria bacterium]|nr:hypothetical protein [Candidatus Uhrbacteria bacterium]
MKTIHDLYLAYVRQAHRTNSDLLPSTILRNLLQELRSNGVPFDNDAVCLVLCRHIFGGTVAELAPGCWLNYVPNGEGVSYEDLCGAGKRSGLPIGTAKQRWNAQEFLDRDETESLASRAKSFEVNFHDLLKSKIPMTRSTP